MIFEPGWLIVFSGLDSAGKSTQIELLLNFLLEHGKKPVYLWSRGGYTGPFNFLKSCLRKILKKKLPPPGRNEDRENAFKKIWIRNIWLILAIFDLILVYGIYIRIIKFFGRCIIADRYLGDTWIDFKLNFPNAEIDQWPLWKVLKWITPKPDASFMLLIDVDESLRRSLLKKEPFPDSKEVLYKRLDMYKGISCTQGYKRIDCLQVLEKIHNEIVETISLKS